MATAAWALESGFFFLFLFWPCFMACGILVPQSGIELFPAVVEAQSLNPWTAREVPGNLEF